MTDLFPLPKHLELHSTVILRLITSSSECDQSYTVSYHHLEATMRNITVHFSDSAASVVW